MKNAYTKIQRIAVLLIIFFMGMGKKLSQNYQKCRWMKKDCLVLHPGPMNRGIEIGSEVADGHRSVILEQVTNGIAIRMAVLYLLAGSKTG